MKSLCSLSFSLVFGNPTCRYPWKMSPLLGGLQEYPVLNTLCPTIYDIWIKHQLPQQNRVPWTLGFMLRLLPSIALLCSTIPLGRPVQIGKFSFLLSFGKPNRSMNQVSISNTTSESPVVSMSMWINVDQLLCGWLQTHVTSQVPWEAVRILGKNMRTRVLSPVLILF